MATQDQWRFCHKCEAMFFDGYPGKGVCAAEGGHESQGFMFVLPHDIPPSPNAQDQWRFCNKCYEMFFDGYPSKGVCKAGGGHASQGFMFVLPHDTPPDNVNQSQWRYCSKCAAMFFDGYPTKGSCPAGGGHASAGFMFVLPHVDDTTMTFDTGNLTSDLPLQGSAHLVITSAGDYTFSCHAHDSGFDNIHYALGAVLLANNGIAFTFAKSGGTEGTSAGLPFGTPRRDDNYITSGNNPSIKNEWGNLAGARFQGKIDGADQLAAGLKGLVSDLVNEVLKEAEQAAAKAVIAIV